MRCTSLLLIGLIAAGGVLWLWHTNESSQNRRSAGRALEGITWNHSHVRTESGDTLLSIDSLPDTVRVSADAQFGSPDRFTGAALSPDSSWLALSLAGEVHAFGWLYDLSAETGSPVAFQYGGEVEFDSWSPDGRFATFVQRSPAPTSVIKLVDRQRIGSLISTTGRVIDVDAEETLDPPYAYRIDRWEAPHTLCFRLAGREYCMDVETHEIVR